MKSEDGKIILPKWRFPEFKNEEGWAVKNGNKIFDQVSEKDPESKLPILAISQEFGAVPREQINYSVIASEKSIEQYKIVRKGDFIISLRSFQGGIEFSEYDGLCSPVYVVLRKIIEINEYFYKFYFKTPIFIRDLNKNLEGIRDGKMVSFKQFSDIKLPYPNLTEQQKIADCLASLDELIAANAQKLEALKAHKKGLMEQLFPVNGEKVPRLRFKEFEGKGEWEETTFGLVAHFLKGKGISKSDIHFKGSIPCIRYGELYTIYNETISEVISRTNVPPKFLTFSKPNDVIIPASGETREDIATASCVLEGGIALGSDINIIRTKINGVFLSYYLNNVKKFELSKLAQGYSVVHLYPDQLKTLSIQIPSEMEQRTIGQCLSTLDESIEAQKRKIEILKSQKSGLLLAIFPI